MSTNVVIIDYQLGNLFSVKQACEYLGYKAIITQEPEKLLKADFAILPGVGAFRDAMQNLQEFGLVQALHEYVQAGKPLMGVCLGLQLLLTDSEEFGSTQGLNIIPGRVKKFNPRDAGGKVQKVPQIQWNVIDEPVPGKWNHSPMKCCRPGDYMYFVHSYYAQPNDDQYVLARTSYGDQNYCSAVIKDNIFATQFHPEKSGLYGVDIYKEWFNSYH